MNSYKINDLKVGHIEQFDVTVTESMMKKFIEISGDINPLHSNSKFAINSGYSDRVVFGMLTSSFYSKLVGVHLPGKYALLNNIKIDFIKTVFVNDKLKILGEVKTIDNRFNFITVRSKIMRDESSVSRADIRVGFNE
tara:strand:+ start:313 stop:726 length:414 start_codon:yes stop_codon:yes gene_type:complete